MPEPQLSEDSRLVELLTRRATEGLEASEQLELRCLLAEHPGVDEDSFDLAAAVVDRALAPPSEPMSISPDLDQSLRKMARDFSATPAAEALSDNSNDNSRRSFLTLLLGGVAAGAAAAIVVMAALGWGGPAGEPDPGPPQSAAERASRLEEEANDLVAASWKNLQGFEDVEGRVIFSPSRQEGYMRFRNLPPNDPDEKQYQLWIVDPERDEEPVDGGVFDIPSDGEVHVPIRPKLKVTDPKAFVITVEQPGGVVVSEGPHRIIAQP